MIKKKCSVILTALFVVLVFSGSALSQDLKSVYQNLRESKYNAALEIINTQFKKNDNPVLYHIKAKACYILSEQAEDRSEKIKLRKKSYDMFKKALWHEKNNPYLFIDYGILLKKRKFYIDSKRMFYKALSIDKDNIAAYLNLLDVFKISRMWDDFQNIQSSSFTRQSDTLSNKEKYNYKQGRSSTFIEKSEIYFDPGNYETFTDMYYNYLNTIDNPDNKNKKEYQEKIFEANYYIMNSAQRNKYKYLPENEKGRFLIALWERLNPNPFTAENEVLLEYRKRLFDLNNFAKISINKKSDDRIKCYMKYGIPDKRVISKPENRQFKEFKIYIPANESWNYMDTTGSLTFDFLNISGNIKTVSTFYDKYPPEVAQYIYKKRKKMGDSFNSLGEKISEDELSRIRKSRNLALDRLKNEGVLFRPQYFYKTGLEYAVKTKSVTEQKNNLVVTAEYEINTGGLMPAYNPDSDKFYFDFDINICIKDTNLNITHNSAFTKRLYKNNKKGIEAETVKDKIQIPVLAGLNRFYIQIVEKNNNTGRLIKKDIITRGKSCEINIGGITKTGNFPESELNNIKNLGQIYLSIDKSDYRNALSAVNGLLKKNSYSDRLLKLKNIILFSMYKDSLYSDDSKFLRNEIENTCGKLSENSRNKNIIKNPDNYVEAGIMLFKIGEYKKAKRIFDNYLKNLGSGPTVNFYTSRIHSRLNEKFHINYVTHTTIHFIDTTRYKDNILALYDFSSNDAELEKSKIDLLKDVKKDSSWANAYMNLAFINCLQKNFKECTESYYEYLSKISTTEEVEDAIRTNELILTKQESKKLSDLPNKDAGIYLLSLWKKRDPNPITPENERLTEHIWRLVYVMNYFKRGEDLFDDRGKWYIKFGQPDDRLVYFPSSFNSYAKETWIYNSINPDLLVTFIDKGYGFIETYDELISAFFRARVLRAKKYANDMIERYTPEYAFKPGLDVYFDICQFKNGDKTNIELSFLIPNMQLEKLINKNKEIITLSYNTDLMSRDLNSNVVDHKNYDLESEYDSYDTFYKSVILDIDCLPYNGEKLERFIQIIEKELNVGNLFHTTINVRNFNPPDLSISDIQFASSISDSNMVKNYKFRKRNISVIPYPFYSMNKNKKIYVYFEVYNLKLDNSSQTEYEVAYLIRNKDKSFSDKLFESITARNISSDEHTIVSSYPAKGNTRDTNEYIQFDFSTLKTGEYILGIRIQDKVSGEKTFITKEFEIIE